MKNTDLPSPHIPILFTDLSGIQHKGFYNELLKAFVERIGEEPSEEVGISYSTDGVAEWEYEDDRESSDADIMEIL